jgi:DNA polymerase III alpha subunit (gram-positive type)
MKHGRIVENVKSFKEAWRDFQHFLTINFDGKIVLVAHNGFRFDGPVLSHNVTEAGYPVPDYEMIDTLPIFKSRLQIIFETI